MRYRYWVYASNGDLLDEWWITEKIVQDVKRYLSPLILIKQSSAQED